MEQNRGTQADMQRWDRTIAAPSRQAQRVAGNWQHGAGSHKVRPPVHQPDIDAWMDRVRVQLDPSPPLKKVELEWVLLAGIAAGVLLLLGGSIYWLSGSSTQKDEPALVAASGNARNATDSASARIGASTPPAREVPAREAPVRAARVPRVTEEAPTLPIIENDSSPALPPAAKTEARTAATALTDEEPSRTDTTGSRIANITNINSAPERTEEAKPEEPKTTRREPTPASARPKPAKPAATKLALAEQAAAPIESAAVASAPSAPAPVITMPRLKSMRAPYYPVSEMRAGHTGTTTIELLVLETGLVGEATVLTSSGYPKLDAAAIEVAKKSWKFFPGTEDGKPMAMKVEAPVRFSQD